MSATSETCEIFLSEERIISPGSTEISRANFRIRHLDEQRKFVNTVKEVKLDSCGSVSLAHSKYLSSIKSCEQYNIPIVSLNGIGGKTRPLTSAGILSHVKSGGKIIKFLCYVFDTPGGNTGEILLLGLRTIVDSNIDIRYHMKFLFVGISKMIKFIEQEDTLLSELHYTDSLPFEAVDSKLMESDTATDWYQKTELFENYENVVLMTEIQLQNIVERLKCNEKETNTDGDETMMKNGVTISKFSFEALGLGPDVDDHIKSKIQSRFEQWTGDDSVFPTKNGSPKILTKFVDHPYSYELLPEYENGEKKLPCVKSMNWEGKTYTAHVIRGFIKELQLWKRARIRDAFLDWL